MYSNGLQDNELQLLHKKIKLNMNFFLQDILDSDLFEVESVKGMDYYNIYPLFYCDRIETDGDAFIKDSYFISCKKDYEQIFLFISDNSVTTNHTYHISTFYKKYKIIYIYDEWTHQPLRNGVFTVKYDENNVKQYTTDNLGYYIFEFESNDFEVIL